MRAIVTEDIVKGAVDANHAGGGPVGPHAWQECNINELTDLDNFDPISGFPVYKSLLCDVVKADADKSSVIIDSGEIKHGEIHKESSISVSDTIYLDHNATTAIAPEVSRTMLELTKVYGNPSSIHREGKKSGKVIEEARRKAAQQINCTARRIVFTGCGAESNNLAVKGIAFANWEKKRIYRVQDRSIPGRSITGTTEGRAGPSFMF